MKDLAAYKEEVSQLKGADLMEEKSKIKKLYSAGEVTYEEGKALAIVVIDRQNELGAALAKKYGKRFSAQKFTTLSRLN